MLVLFETPAGFAVFKLLDEKKLRQSDDLFKDFQSADAAKKVVKLKSFEKFEDTTEALASAASLVEGKMSKGLKKMLKKVFAKDAHEKLAVADAKLGQAIKSKLEIDCVADSAVGELMRGIRAQLSDLVPGVEDKDMKAMSLGLAHSLSRYKLKFSPDKVDTMIVQAVSLLDDLDKELNNYMMRAREWYGWHFPELGKIITDNIAYIRTVQDMGVRENCKNVDLSDILPEEIEARVKEAAEISMGTEISDIDMLNIRHLCDQVHYSTQYEVFTCANLYISSGYGNSRVPRTVVRLPEEQDGRHRAKLDRGRRRTYRRQADFACRLPHQFGQTPCFHCANLGRREGSVQGSQDQTRHPQVWSHLPRAGRRPSQCAPEGKSL